VNAKVKKTLSFAIIILQQDTNLPQDKFFTGGKNQ